MQQLAGTGAASARNLFAVFEGGTTVRARGTPLVVVQYPRLIAFRRSARVTPSRSAAISMARSFMARHRP
jgi:hypothetical protein